MEKAYHYFPGGNTAAGFVNLFDGMLKREKARRVYYLKGGPGVGKSSLMHALAKQMRAKGRLVEYFHCSSDPDSLDGVAFPEIGAVMMDATAPHAMEPQIPGAVDTLVNLGDYLDEKALAQKLSEIQAVMAGIPACFQRAYHYLEAARQVEKAQAIAWGDGLPRTRTEALAGKLMEGYLPKAEGLGEKRDLFSEAFTPKGYISHLADLNAETVVCLAAPFGLNISPLLEELEILGRKRGQNAVCLHDPLDARRLSHVLFPESGTLFTTARGIKQAENIPILQELHLSLPEERPGFDKNAFELLAQRAVESLAQAKARHDALEKHYIAHMDFSGWEQTKIRILSQLDQLAE